MASVTNIRKGIEIFEKYESSSCCAEHDIIYAGPYPKNEVSKEDAETLEKLGWFEDRMNDSWAIFT